MYQTGKLHFLPRFYYRNNYASGRKLDISYRTNYRLPSLNQLFPISNNLNQLNVYKGNITYKAVAEVFGYKYTPPSQAIS